MYLTEKIDADLTLRLNLLDAERKLKGESMKIIEIIEQLQRHCGYS